MLNFVDHLFTTTIFEIFMDIIRKLLSKSSCFQIYTVYCENISASRKFLFIKGFMNHVLPFLILDVMIISQSNVMMDK